MGPKLKKVCIRFSHYLHFPNQKNELHIYCEFQIVSPMAFLIPQITKQAKVVFSRFDFLKKLLVAIGKKEIPTLSLPRTYLSVLYR